MVEIHKIIGKDLKSSLENDVFRQIEDSDSEFPFISESTIKSLKLYRENKKDLKSSKELWKNLIIDAICILKVNDSRERIYDASRSTKDSFMSGFEDIRKTSSYGIDELSTYFDDFVKFESVLYGTDEHYRDHVGHVLQVWAIGISLLTHNKITFSNGFSIHNDATFHFDIKSPEGKEEVKVKENGEELEGKEEEEKGKYISRSELWAMWSIISLCHDLGYPIEKASKINQQVKKIISHFGNMNFSELNYSFDILNTFLVDKFLNIISSKADRILKRTSIQTKYRDKFSKSLEDFKHGIFSSILLFKNLTYFLETDYSQQDVKLSYEDLRQFHIRKEILRSIAGHTCSKIYHLELNTLSFLLILCDELQEWDRPNFDEVKNKVSVSEPEVILKEFSMTNEQKVHIQLTYNESFDEKYRIHLVYERYKTIHNLLRSAKDDVKRKNHNIVFIWDILFINKKFSLNFDSTLDPFKLLQVNEITIKSDKKFGKSKIIEIYNDLDESESKLK
jgi:hypothetical protein